jgi:hypothetical protein
MTQTDQEIIMGKAHLERVNSNIKMQALRKQASDLGIELERAGKALQQNPESLGFDEEHSTAFPRFEISVNRGSFDSEKIFTLLQDIRSTRQTINRANAALDISKFYDE